MRKKFNFKHTRYKLRLYVWTKKKTIFSVKSISRKKNFVKLFSRKFIFYFFVDFSALWRTEVNVCLYRFLSAVTVAALHKITLLCGSGVGHHHHLMLLCVVFGVNWTDVNSSAWWFENSGCSLHQIYFSDWLLTYAYYACIVCTQWTEICENQVGTYIPFG